MRKTRALHLVLVPVLLSGCGGVEEAMQRDVYTKFEDCMADWGKTELCQQMQEAESKKFAEQTTGVQGGGGSHMVYWGPSYYPGQRSVMYNGQTYTPNTNLAMSRPFMVTSKSSLAARSSPGTARASSVARGGFGGGGHAASGSSGG